MTYVFGGMLNLTQSIIYNFGAVVDSDELIRF